MTEEDWFGLASVYRAGADCSGQWSLNSNRQQEAMVMHTMADRCEHLAGQRPFLVIDGEARPGAPGSEDRPYSYHRSQEEADEAVTRLAGRSLRWRVKRSPGRSVR